MLTRLPLCSNPWGSNKEQLNLRASRSHPIESRVNNRVREVSVLKQLRWTSRLRWDVSLVVSFAAHGLVLLILLHHSRPVFIMPSDVALGTPRSSGRVIYLAPTGAERAVAIPEKPSLAMRASPPKPPSVPKPLPVIPEPEGA